MTSLNKDDCLRRFRLLLKMRHFDEACLEGAQDGDVHGELHLGIGQEAIAAGMAEFLRQKDAVVSHHRNHFHALAKGVDDFRLLAEIFEKQTGICRGRGGHMHPFDMTNNFSASGIVGASFPVALGYAYAFWLRGEDSVAVAVAGDAATNQGTFHESLNIASAWKLPLVVVIENNGYGISVQTDHVLATETIAERSVAYNMWGKKVDGTDVDAVADAFDEAMQHTRDGNGPALLEATCNRFRGHFEGDADFYRSKREMEDRRQSQDPIKIYQQRLIASGHATEPELTEITENSKSIMRNMLEKVRLEPSPDPADALKYVFPQE
jgi:TPP-dependent pyruvate/acetoin dehydrogenase alpha subunit